jgi:hypothetical protein
MRAQVAKNIAVTKTEFLGVADSSIVIGAQRRPAFYAAGSFAGQNSCEIIGKGLICYMSH